jgi:hypothetical protein
MTTLNNCLSILSIADTTYKIMFVQSFYKKFYKTKQASAEQYINSLIVARTFDNVVNMSNNMLKSNELIDWSCAICNERITINALAFDKMSIDKMLCNKCCSIDNVYDTHYVTIMKHLNSFRQFLQKRLYSFFNITDIKTNIKDLLIHK